MRAFLAIPAVLLAMTVVYVAANPTSQSIGQVPVDPTSTQLPTVAPTATANPVSLPGGVTGHFTYRSDGEIVALKLPSAEELAREPAPLASARQPSADGEWEVLTNCDDTGNCTFSFFGPNRATSTIEAGFGRTEWSTGGHAFAFSGTIAGYPDGGVFIVDDPAAPAPRRVFESPAVFGWLADGALLVAWDSRFVRISPDGTATDIATSPALVQLMYASPDGHTFAFTQNDIAGWRLWTVDAETGMLHDLGNMGSDPAGIQPPTELAPEQKTSMYIAWSPDGASLAFGGGFEPPYTMTIVDLTTGAVSHTDFPHGYPGEIEWSPDGTRLAVSTYDPERTRHESYIVDPATGAATYLLSGCIIVWSHDSRFLAVHGEPEPGISIVDVESGAQGKLTHERNDTPWKWTE